MCLLSGVGGWGGGASCEGSKQVGRQGETGQSSRAAGDFHRKASFGCKLAQTSRRQTFSALSSLRVLEKSGES